MCVIQTTKVFTSTQPCFVYKVVDKLHNVYYSCVNASARISQRHNSRLYSPTEWEEIYNNEENLFDESGTNEQYIIDQEKTSSFPGFYCLNTEKDARAYIEEFKYINNPTILMCLIPKDTQMFNGEIRVWPESRSIMSINVFKLIPIRDLG